MNAQFESTQVQLSNGATITIETFQTSLKTVVDKSIHDESQIDDEVDEEDVSFGLPSFTPVKEAVVAFSNEILETLQQVRPSKANVEFGLKISSDKDSIVACVVPIAGEIHIKVTLEWSGDRSSL